MLHTLERPKRLVLIRHGESARNAAKQGRIFFQDAASRASVQGIPDQAIELTPEGQRQARETGSYLRNRFGAPHSIYNSGYVRTVLTTESILEAYPEEKRASIQVHRNLLLRERDHGYTYDMTEAEAAAAFPWLQPYWDTMGGFFARPPGGESIADVAHRTYDFLNAIFRDCEDQVVFVVIHVGVLRCFRFILEEWTYDQALAWPEGQSPKNCGVTSYVQNPESGRLLLEDYNVVGY